MDYRFYCLLAVSLVGISKTEAQATLEQSQNGTITTGDQVLDADDDLEYIYPNVLSVKFHLRQTLIVELITRISMQEMACPIQQCNITLADIADAIQFERYNNTDIVNAIESMNITGRDAYNMFIIYEVNATTIENILTKLGVTFSEIYKTFVDSLQDPSNTIPQILTAVNVSVLDFMNAQAYGNDTTKLQVLAAGNYSLVNIQTVLNITNKTCTDVLQAIPFSTIAKQLRNFDETDSRNFLKNLGVTSTSLLEFYSYLNVTTIHFVAYPSYMQLLTDFEMVLNPEEVLATVTANTTLVTSNKAKAIVKFQIDNTEFVRNYSYFQTENIENPTIHYHVVNVTETNNEYESGEIAFIEVSRTFQGNFSTLAAVYNTTTLSNCTYVTKLPHGEIHTENFTMITPPKDALLNLTKTNMTVYILGSPLFCENKLVAMATLETPNAIQFSTFKKKSNETAKPSSQKPAPPLSNITTPIPSPTEKPSAASTNSVGLIFILLLGLINLFN